MKNSTRFWGFFTLFLWVLATACSSPPTEVVEPGNTYPFRIPRLSDFQLDGKFAEWQDISPITLTADEENRIAPDTFEGWFKLAWKSDGLALYAKVKDDFLKEEKAPMLQNDGLEFFISQEQGSRQMIQYIISPGISEGYPEARIEKVDYGVGQSFTGVKDMQLVAEPTPDGYQLEGFIPFASLGFAPQSGDTLGINFYINDADQQGRAVRHSWHYFPSTYNNRQAQYLLVLSEQETTPRVTTKVYLEDTAIYRFSVLGSADVAGKTVSLKSDSQTLAEKILTADGDYAQADFSVEKSTVPTDVTWTLELDGTYDQPIEPGLVPLRYINLPQPHRFEQAIRIFEAEDKQHPPARDGVLFIGSSSIRMWPHLAQNYPEYEVVQRGFGGSRTEDVLYFYDRIVTPYQPKTIVYFEGVNDINIGRSPDSVVANTEQFLQQVAQDMPGTEVIVLSTTVSVKKKALKEQYLATNKLLEATVKKYPHAYFLDLMPDMLNEQGQPRAEIFSKDSTHMNPLGYQVWLEKISPILEEIHQ